MHDMEYLVSAKRVLSYSYHACEWEVWGQSVPEVDDAETHRLSSHRHTYIRTDITARGTSYGIFGCFPRAGNGTLES